MEAINTFTYFTTLGLVRHYISCPAVVKCYHVLLIRVLRGDDELMIQSAVASVRIIVEVNMVLMALLLIVSPVEEKKSEDIYNLAHFSCDSPSRYPAFRLSAYSVCV